MTATMLVSETPPDPSRFVWMLAAWMLLYLVDPGAAMFLAMTLIGYAALVEIMNGEGE
jgi:hypothetical protein